MQLSDPRALLVDESFADIMAESLGRVGLNNIEFIFTRGNADFSQTGIAHQRPFSMVGSNAESAPPAVPGAGPEDVLAFSYTSGTTGVPKGVLLTDRMLRACAKGAAIANEAGPGEVMLMWESFCHIGGVQMICVCLIYLSVMALLPRFSASRFWDQARHYKATRVHYLGSVLPILLKQPPRADDKNHSVKIAWGPVPPVGFVKSLRIVLACRFMRRMV
ncbi:MAG: AMP-binding protein [Synergistaceae bacterium]|nr:AMP-binding protein [Synergistaceae bacterium]